jgi:hypothetical protein
MANQYLPGVVAIPSMLLITGITQSVPMVVTFSVPSTGANTYAIGQFVWLTVPKTWGMFQANGLIGRIIQIGTSTMALNIDSSQFDPFIYNPTSAESPASLAPGGSQNYEFSNSSSLVPFQSLNNIGN